MSTEFTNFFPCRWGAAYQFDAANALHGHQEIDRAEDRPPTLAGVVQPVIAVQPFFAFHGGPVAAEIAGLDFEAQEPEPVAQPPVADEIAGVGQEQFAKPEAAVQMGTPLAQAPQAGRVQAADHHLALGHQHALDFAQSRVRVGIEFQ
jgi:hypothetical protein